MLEDEAATGGGARLGVLRLAGVFFFDEEASVESVGGTGKAEPSAAWLAIIRGVRLGGGFESD